MFLKTWTAITLLGSALAAPTETSYDYIIVGGGTAGSALAARLSTGLPDASILLLEAGPSALDELRINVPGLRGSTLGSEYDWNFTTVPQPHLDGRQIGVPRGHVLGGSSALNFLCYDRAAAAEYDVWAELGSPGWTWDAMIEAMTRSENFTGSDRDERGRAGPVKNLYNRVVFDVLRSWQPAAVELGLPLNEEGNMGGNPVGLMFQGTNIDGDTHARSYAANSYLPLAGSNLEVRTNTQVAKINLEPSSEGKVTAAGVILTDGTVIPASKEVILSAGSVSSPALLELSGIGQPAVVAAAGAQPLVDLPAVGENYQDHIRVSNTYRLRPGVESYDPMIFDAGSALAVAEMQKWLAGEMSLYEYTTSAYGFLDWGQVAGADAQARLLALAEAAVGNSASVIDRKKLDYLRDATIPDLELILDANYVGAAGYPGGPTITIFSSVMHPLSRGSVHVDTSGRPIVDPRYLDNEHDLQGLVEGTRLTRRLAKTGPMAAFIESEYEPGVGVESDEELAAWVRATMESFYHPVGTCAMLPREEGGVVDADLRVYGTENLRVVDNSVIPVILTGHIQTAAYGIAEVAAVRIIEGAK